MLRRELIQRVKSSTTKHDIIVDLVNVVGSELKGDEETEEIRRISVCHPNVLDGGPSIKN